MTIEQKKLLQDIRATLYVVDFVEQMVAAEREACAKIAMQHAADNDGMSGEVAAAEAIAEKIRARGRIGST